MTTQTTNHSINDKTKSVKRFSGNKYIITETPKGQLDGTIRATIK